MKYLWGSFIIMYIIAFMCMFFKVKFIPYGIIWVVVQTIIIYLIINKNTL